MSLLSEALKRVGVPDQVQNVANAMGEIAIENEVVDDITQAEKETSATPLPDATKRRAAEIISDKIKHLHIKF